MERLRLKYNTAKKAMERLKKGIDSLSKVEKEEKNKELYLTFRDSAIKRFELSVDTLWKYTKLYLNIKKGAIQNSPKSVFKESLRCNLISESETKSALEMIDARNMTSHIYKEEVAQEIISKIPGYYKLMSDFLNRLCP